MLTKYEQIITIKQINCNFYAELSVICNNMKSAWTECNMFSGCEFLAHFIYVFCNICYRGLLQLSPCNQSDKYW